MASDNIFAAMQGAVEEEMAKVQKEGKTVDHPDFLSAVASKMVLGNPNQLEKVGKMYCNKCGDYRTMDIFGLYIPKDTRQHGAYYIPLPSFFKINCRECDQKFHVILYKTDQSDSNVCVLPYSTAFIATPHTPIEVRFYLEQAFKSQIGGAYTAALPMYREALEEILSQHGYKGTDDTKTCGGKLSKLQKDIISGTVPAEFKDIENGIMLILKKLGDWGVHADIGKVSDKRRIDADLCQKVSAVFTFLLEKVYEQPAKQAEIKAHLGSILPNM